jgi:hypothetical protein
MTRLSVFICCFVVGAAVAAGAAEAVVISAADGPLTCYIYDAEHLPGVRIVIAGHDGKVQELARSEASFVGHGWVGPCLSSVEGIPVVDLASILYASLRFDLTINGSRVAPDYMAMWPFEGDGEMVWGMRLHYEFPPGFFAAGIHIVAGTWSIVGYPCEWRGEGGCEPIQPDSGEIGAIENGKWNVSEATKTLTLVVY